MRKCHESKPVHVGAVQMYGWIWSKGIRGSGPRNGHRPIADHLFIVHSSPAHYLFVFLPSPELGRIRYQILNPTLKALFCKARRWILSIRLQPGWSPTPVIVVEILMMLTRIHSFSTFADHFLTHWHHLIRYCGAATILPNSPTIICLSMFLN